MVIDQEPRPTKALCEIEEQRQERLTELDVVDEASDESFPASDSPSWIPIQVSGGRESSQSPAIRIDEIGSSGAFALFDCSLARFATGRSCANLPELLEAMRTAPEMVLEHHMIRCALDRHFELYEFPNDLAHWCWGGLGDRILSEELSLVDPYALPTISALRSVLIKAIERRLENAEPIQCCRLGRELHLVGSRLLACDTGKRFHSVAEFAEALPRLPLRSFFYHVHEARRQRKNPSDDFSAWLKRVGAESSLVDSLSNVDFSFLNLTQLRREFVAAFRESYRPATKRAAT